MQTTPRAERITVKEAARILEVHPNTIRSVMLNGLKSIGGERFLLESRKDVGSPRYTTLAAIERFQAQINSYGKF